MTKLHKYCISLIYIFYILGVIPVCGGGFGARFSSDMASVIILYTDISDYKTMERQL